MMGRGTHEPLLAAPCSCQLRGVQVQQVCCSHLMLYTSPADRHLVGP